MKRTILLILAAALLYSCATEEESKEIEWSIMPEKPNEYFVDVIWFSGSLVGEEKDDEGNLLSFISLSEQQKELFREDAGFAQRFLFPDSVNFFSPLYHQFTLSGLHTDPQQFDTVVNLVADEAYDIFHEYMLTINKGRPYILAGMSQGAMMVKGILQRMSDGEYKKMRAAYMLGFGLSEEDLKCPHIIPAEDELERGVTISYNSVASYEGIWPFVYNNAATCINPVTWSTDTTKATFEWHGDTLTVQRDTLYNILILRGESAPRLMGVPEPWNDDNRHYSDYFVYTDYIRRNALRRAYR